ncbi:MAG TPA: lysylphosphatidylglycerol synthase domain-containing protein [Verrucomicrobiae bacterium]|nr:lysylphosphatidylglycerol synthase domain-containing protein [Verrucomicrobiae bacterium]
MKVLNAILLALGTALLAGLLWSIGPKELWRELSSFGWGLIPFMMCEGIAEMIHTFGWRRCFNGELRTVPWSFLFRVRMAGYAINYLTPTASLGGEVTRTTLLASKGRVSQAASGVLIGKVCFSVAHLVFVAIGTIFILRTVRLPRFVWVPLLLSALVVGSGIFAFFLLQMRGKLGAPIRWLASKGIGGGRLEKVESNLTTLDEELRAFYRERPRDMFYAVCCHLLGYSVGIAQTWFFFHLLQPPAVLSIAAAIWFLGMWFDLLTFAIPMNVGSLEGSRVFLFGLFRFPAPLGMAYGIALRLAQILWAMIGLAFYCQLLARKGQSPATKPVSNANQEQTISRAQL